ncbi:MAG: hypothetical protein ACRDIV_17500 [Ktedonobacteraceae bacterium]
MITRWQWHEAQEQQRKAGGNAVFTPDHRGAITGYEELGWLVITCDLSLKVRTAEGVQLALEELGLPQLGWS